jgi:hypothetical protein
MPDLAEARQTGDYVVSNVAGVVNDSPSAIQDQATVVSEKPGYSESFVNSIGINTDFAYPNTVYGSRFSTVVSLLDHLGIKHIRDAIDTGYIAKIAQLAGYGIHEDVVSSINEKPSTIIDYVAALPKGTVDAVEGLNEWNLSGDPHWTTDVYNYQKSLYAHLKASPVTAHIPVLAPAFDTFEAAVVDWPKDAYENICDYGNTHDYFGSYNPGKTGSGGPHPSFGLYGSIPYWMATASYDSGSKPIVSTETGYNDGDTYPPNRGSVSDSVKARYTMRTLLLSWNYGIQRTYLYQLIDVLGQNFGLLTGTLKAKPVYFALENLITDLESSSAEPALTPLTYSLTVPSGALTIRHTLLQSSATTYHLFLWDEVAAEDPVVPSQVVTVTFSKHYNSVSLYRWNDQGSISIETVPLSSKNSVTFKATDRVSELRFNV